jgi:large subunit ribosomal protein L4
MLASRNLYHVGVTSVAEVGPVSLVGFDKVVMTSGALKALEEKLA